MDIQLAARAALAAERLPPGSVDRDSLLRAGSTELWLQAAEAPSLPLVSPGGDQAGQAPFACATSAVGWHDSQYPEGLRHLACPPPALFVRGSEVALPPAQRCVAVIGSRRCTELGRSMARELSAGLVGEGLVVVSGLALGIDAAAHEGALDAGGSTLAVLASAADCPTPHRNRGLAAEILEQGGWLVSERPPGATVRAWDFPRRNRLVAALVSVVVVVEAGLRSGTLSTVRHALDLGVEVAAVPGPATSPASAGAHELLRRGAHLVTRVQDVLELVGVPAVPAEAGSWRGDEGAVMAGLPGACGSIDSWLRASALPRERARAALHRLLLGGALQRLAGGRIARVL
jgi:DNA processing protein